MGLFNERAYSGVSVRFITAYVGKNCLKKKKVNFELQMFCLGVREDQKQEFSNAKLEVI